MPPECFPSRNRHANLQCGEKKLAAQQFALSCPPSSRQPPPLPLSVLSFLLLFPDTAVLCQCVTSQCSSPENVKTFPAVNRGMGEWLPYGVHTSPRYFTSPSFSTGAEVVGRRRRNERIGSLSFLVKFEMRLSSFPGAGRLPTAEPALPNLSFYHLSVDRKGCSSGLFLSCSVIEEMVTGSRCWAALLPAATGLAWLWASQLPDTP